MSVGGSWDLPSGAGAGLGVPTSPRGIPASGIAPPPRNAREPRLAPGAGRESRAWGRGPHSSPSPPTSPPLTLLAQIQYLSPDPHLDPRLILLQVIVGRASLGWGLGRRRRKYGVS